MIDVQSSIKGERGLNVGEARELRIPRARSNSISSASYHRFKLGYCALFDGDHKDHPQYSNFYDNPEESTLFPYPYDAPEKLLVKAYLNENPNNQLNASLDHQDHHGLFQRMVDLGLAADKEDALSECYSAFKSSAEYLVHFQKLREFLVGVLTKYSEIID